jgi:hypothetical protein
VFGVFVFIGTLDSISDTGTQKYSQQDQSKANQQHNNEDNNNSTSTKYTNYI